MRFLITGHTGFKGAWLGGLLSELGHQVSGISLPPLNNSLFTQARMNQYFESSQYLDITFGDIYLAMKNTKPDAVIHLAAQSLVPESYKFPIKTFETNVMGTLRVLEACSKLDFIQAVLIITSDKVYKNSGLLEPFQEDDQLGGNDPYSASKSAADIATQSWAKSMHDFRINIARSGNVIGGGDFADTRLVPDIVKSIISSSHLEVRNLKAVRPWQHVLDCLNGYNILINHQIKNREFDVWNFGPELSQYLTVQELITNFSDYWGSFLDYTQAEPTFNESQILRLNTHKVNKELKYSNKLDFLSSVQWTVDWYKSPDPEKITKIQIKKYLNL